MSHQVYVHERAKTKRLIIDVNPDRYPFNPFKIRPGQALWFCVDNPSDTVSKVVSAWVEQALKDPSTGKEHSVYLPDIILTHAAEWGLQ